MKKFSVKIYFVIILIFINLFAILTIKNKNQYHIDEVWSFALSNSYDQPFLYNWIDEMNLDKNSELNIPEKSNFYNAWHSPSEFHEYVSVQESEKFSYDKVLYNQKCDTHPPLYYFIVHTICSFFPNTVSKWFLAGINIVLITPTILLLFLLAKDLTKSSKIALFSIALWGFSRAFINDIAFLRMYMLLTFFSVTLAYITNKFLNTEKKIYLPFIILTNILGFLTQYYFYIFSFFITAFTCIYFFIKKKYKLLITYGLCVISSVIISIALFPSIFNHLFKGCYTNVVSNAILNILIYIFLGILYFSFGIFCDFFGIFSIKQIISPIIISTLFGIYFGLIIFLIFLKVSGKKTQFFKHLKNFIKNNTAYFIITISTICSILLIGVISPYMNYFYDRYILFLLPLIAIILIHIIFKFIFYLLKNLKEKANQISTLITILVILLLSLSSNLTVQNYYLGLQKSDIKYEEMLKGKTCYFIPRNPYFIHAYSMIFKDAKMVYPALEMKSNLIELIQKNEQNDKEVFLIIEKNLYTKDYIEILLNASKLKYECITETFLYTEEEAFNNPNYIYKIIY